MIMFYGCAPLLVRPLQIMETAVLKAYEWITSVWNVQMDDVAAMKKDVSGFLKYMKRYKCMGYINNDNEDISFSRMEMIHKKTGNANRKVR